MTFSPGLAVYLAISARLTGWTSRRLDRRAHSGKEDPARLGERRGEASRPRPSGPLIWFHAASVGEAASLLELVEQIGAARPDVTVLMTTGTVTSAQLMAERLPARAIHQYSPLDVRSYVTRFLDHWKPDAAVWTESELWPRMVVETSRRGTPMVLLNARMSNKSFRNWRWMRGAAQSVLGRFSHILAQDDTTALYLTRLGLPQDKVDVIGTLKEGAPVLPCREEDRAKAAAWIGTRPVWFAGSTHEGEEEIIARAHRIVRRRSHRLLLILAPRHPARGDRVSELLRADGFSVAQRSKAQMPGPDTQIYVADTLGEMGLWFRLAPVSFIAGSLAPIGGHNPFEPAALGSAILHGPHVTNFAPVYRRLAEAGAAVEVSDAETLAEAVDKLLAPDRVAAMAHAAWEVSTQGAAVTKRAFDEIVSLLPAKAA